MLLRAPAYSTHGGAAMERMLERCAGLDVHKKTVTACVRVPGTHGDRTEHVRTFDATTAGLLVLRDWLAAHAVTHVANRQRDVQKSKSDPPVFAGYSIGMKSEWRILPST